MDSAGRRFVEAIASRDPGALTDSLSPEVDFKALTPRRFWEASTPGEVLEIVFGSWFEEQDEITGVSDVTEDEVADTSRIGYRFDLELPDGSYVVEQQAYYRAGVAGIDHLRIVCSGFRPR